MGLFSFREMERTALHRLVVRFTVNTVRGGVPARQDTLQKRLLHLTMGAVG